MKQASEFRDMAREKFMQEFDFATFDMVIEDFFKVHTSYELIIGLCDQSSFDGNYLKQKHQSFNGKYHCSKYIAFAYDYECYVWRTCMQISHDVYPFVREYLTEHGYLISAKGACGYGDFDVLTVRLYQS